MRISTTLLLVSLLLLESKLLLILMLLSLRLLLLLLLQAKKTLSSHESLCVQLEKRFQSFNRASKNKPILFIVIPLARGKVMLHKKHPILCYIYIYMYISIIH